MCVHEVFCLALEGEPTGMESVRWPVSGIPI